MNHQLRIQIRLWRHWFLGKSVGWVRRYLPAEIAGTSAALLGITLALHLDQSLATAAIVGVWSEIGGFYGVIILQEWRAAQRCQPLANPIPIHNRCPTRPRVWHTYFTSVRQTIGFLYRLLRNLVLEFGAAELLDPFILRPALLLLAMQLIAQLPVALMAGKLAADLVFYTVTIGSFEVRKKLLAT